MIVFHRRIAPEGDADHCGEACPQVQETRYSMFELSSDLEISGSPGRALHEPQCIITGLCDITPP